MNNKDRTIKACKQLIKRYRNPDKAKGDFFRTENCLLCKIHYSSPRCLGCPLAGQDVPNYGCRRFASYLAAEDEYEAYEELGKNISCFTETFNKRADFYERIIPILEELPPERFTNDGWSYFEELNRDW